MIKINGNEYRNIQEQVSKNMVDIKELKKRVPYEDVFYTAEETDAKFQTIEGMSDYATVASVNAKQNKLYDYNITVTKNFTLAQWTAMGGNTSDFPAGTTAVEVEASFNGLSSKDLTITSLLQIFTDGILLDNIWGSIWPHDDDYDSDVDEEYFNAALRLVTSIDPVTQEINKVGIFPCHAGIRWILFDEGTYDINVSKNTI